jgi:hypothetical protein
VIDPGGGNVVTVESVSAAYDDIDRKLEAGRDGSGPEQEPNEADAADGANAVDRADGADAAASDSKERSEPDDETDPETETETA